MAMFGPNISCDEAGQSVEMPMSLGRGAPSIVDAFMGMPKIAPPLMPCGSGDVTRLRVAASIFRFLLNATRILAVVTSRSEEHTSELQSLMRNSYAVFCL